MITFVVPEGEQLATRRPDALTGTIALLPRVCPADQLSAEATGAGAPAAKRRKLPAPVVVVTVALTESALTLLAGMPHTPATGNSRSNPQASNGAPRGPGARRVSTRTPGP